MGASGTIYRDDLPVLDYATQTVDKLSASELPLVDLLESMLAPLSTVAKLDEATIDLALVESLRKLHLGQITASALVRRGEALRAGNDHRGAASVLEQAIAANPKHFASQLLLADSLMFAGEADRAREHFAAAVEIRPESGRAQYGLAVAMFQAQELPLAAVHFNLAITSKRLFEFDQTLPSIAQTFSA